MRYCLLLFVCWVAPLSAQTLDSVRTFRSEHLDSTKTWYTKVRTDTLWRTKADSVAPVDTTPKPLPSVGVSVGAFHYPLAILGTYNATTIIGGSTLLTDLATAKKAKARVVVAISLGKTTAPDTTWRTKVDTVKHDTTRVVVSVATVLSVKSSVAEIKRWSDIAPFVADGTVLAVYVGDDITSKPLWGPNAPYLAKYDSIACGVKARWPQALTVIRAKPTDLVGWSYKCLGAGWGQYSHITRDGEPLAYAQRQWASAQMQHLCLILGLNSINGGDGSSGVAGSQPGRFEMTGAEVLKYGSIFARFTPAIIWWEDRPANRARIAAGVASLRAVADTTPRTSCK